MTIGLILLAALTIAACALAMSMKSAVHSVLAFAMGLIGVAAVYLQLGAQFLGFAQVLVYVGAVSILAVFAIMTTQHGDATGIGRNRRGTAWTTCSSVLIAGGVFATIVWSFWKSGVGTTDTVQKMPVPVSALGSALVHEYSLPLEVIGFLLTAAMVGAVIVAMPEKGKRL